MTTLPMVWRPALDTIYAWDALSFLGQMETGSVHCVITDPPYGLGVRVFEFPHKHYKAINESWDHYAPISWMSEVRRILKPGGSVLCFGVRQSIYQFAAEGLRLGWRIVNDITWHKPDAAPNFTGRMMTESTERILWFCPDGSKWIYNLDEAKAMNGNQNLRDVWIFGQTREDRTHPAQKPLDLMARVVRLFTNPGDLILDPFMGSGTTAIAARNLKRHYIGCDISPVYVQLANHRLHGSGIDRLNAKEPATLDDLPLFRKETA